MREFDGCFSTEMGAIRAGIRLVLLALATALGYILVLIGTPLRLVSGPAYRRWRDAIFMAWSRALGWIFGMRSTVTGPVPKPPFFLVTNHLGYIDIILLASCVRAVFVAKHEIAGWPLAGRIVASVDTIFIDRERKRAVVEVNRQVAEALDRGEGVILFPEGTSSSGDTVLPLMPSLLDVPASRQYPVCYAGIRYETPDDAAPARDVVCWWGDESFAPHLLRLLKLPRFKAHLAFAAEPITGVERKDLATRLHAGILREHTAGALSSDRE